MLLFPGCDLLYGEVLPAGVSRMLDARHLDASKADTLYDLGSGLGKLVMQAFLQFPNLKKVSSYLAQTSLSRSFTFAHLNSGRRCRIDELSL